MRSWLPTAPPQGTRTTSIRDNHFTWTFLQILQDISKTRIGSIPRSSKRESPWGSPRLLSGHLAFEHPHPIKYCGKDHSSNSDGLCPSTSLAPCCKGPPPAPGKRGGHQVGVLQDPLRHGPYSKLTSLRPIGESKFCPLTGVSK